MNGTSMKGAWEIGTIMGIPIRIHYSWLIVFGLITWLLSSRYFPQVTPDLPFVSYWISGVLAALLLFASVAFHELAHSYVAQKYKLTIESITLFIFGGVAQLRGDPPHPRAEFWIAIAGPLSSFFLSGLFFLLTINMAGGARALFAYLAQINFFIGVFNLIPGFPMDGGRVLRSAIWGKKKDFFYATQKASSIGKGIALFFIFFGLFSIFTGGSGGLWLMFIGWFLYSAAQASYQQSTLQEALSGIKVRDVMVREMQTVDPSISLDRAVDEYFLKYGYGGFPVLDNGKFLGILTLKEIKEVPRGDWGRVRVSNVFVPHDKKWEVSPDADVMKALELMIKEDKGRIVITERDKIIGLITRNGIARYVQIKGSPKN
ncbi:MAG: site-2 protease family protein [Deltaproteobacteria bacterium]|nr:site-2 protease family protein [Deltaproteobacteria bacterium]